MRALFGHALRLLFTDTSPSARWQFHVTPADKAWRHDVIDEALEIQAALLAHVELIAPTHYASYIDTLVFAFYTIGHFYVQRSAPDKANVDEFHRLTRHFASHLVARIATSSGSLATNLACLHLHAYVSKNQALFEPSVDREALLVAFSRCLSLQTIIELSGAGWSLVQRLLDTEPLIAMLYEPQNGSLALRFMEAFNSIAIAPAPRCVELVVFNCALAMSSYGFKRHRRIGTSDFYRGLANMFDCYVRCPLLAPHAERLANAILFLFAYELPRSPVRGWLCETLGRMDFDERIARTPHVALSIALRQLAKEVNAYAARRRASTQNDYQVDSMLVAG
jgi:hypothetical protein